MTIYDISQEVFDCNVFPGDPKPERKVMMTITSGQICNLTALSMCAHNGTHVDAPYHFYNDGKTIDKLSMEKLIGSCYVTHLDGEVTAEAAERILKKAGEADKNGNAGKRILIGGKATVTIEAAKVFAQNQIYLIGNESQTVGPEDGPEQVHYILLKEEIVLLEGIRLSKVPDGVYLLNAAPLNLSGSDGAPCRAVLLKTE